MTAENISTFPDAIRNPQVLSQAELAEKNPGAQLSIILSDLRDGAGRRYDGLHEIKFVKLPPYAQDAWKDMGQGWFQHLPGYGYRPAHINGTGRTDGEVVTGEMSGFVIYDTIDPVKQDEVDRAIQEGAMIPSKIPVSGTLEYESLMRSRFLVATDPNGNIHWRIIQQYLSGKVVSMQLEQPEITDTWYA